MKFSTIARMGKALTLAVLLLAGVSVFAGEAPMYKFRNPTLVSGTAGQVNAVYRFPNVYTSGTNVDALVTIIGMTGGITLQNIDRTADGYDEAFQPEYRLSAITNGYIEFRITFVTAGTSTPMAQPVIDVSGLDIDGSTNGLLTLKEFNRIDMGGGYCNFNSLHSELSVSTIGTAFEGANYTGTIYGALVDTAAKEVMYSVSNYNVTSFTYRVGAVSLLNGNSTRYASLYFRTFSYPYGVLAVNNLSSFTGSAAPARVDLSWSIAEKNTVSTMELEKSSDGKNFTTAAMFFNAENPSRDFSFSDKTPAIYYRLKITGIDGKPGYSNTLKFIASGNKKESLTVFPTLVSSSLTVNYTAENNQPVSVIISDMQGRVVKREQMQVKEGTNSMRLSGFDRFTKGMYLVSVSSGETRETKQVIVQ